MRLGLQMFNLYILVTLAILVSLKAWLNIQQFLKHLPT